jgi:hypothetical protein
MIRISIAKYIDLGMDMQALMAVYGMLETPMGGAGALGIAAALPPSKRLDEMSAEEKEGLKETLENAKTLAREIGLPTSLRFLTWLEDDPPETRREFKLLISAIRAEMEDRLFVCLPQQVAQYYENGDLVTDTVVDAFPKASEEIRTSGTCLAAGLSTACVFHAMRAAEIGLRALGTEFNITIKSGKPIELAEWREILDGLSNAARDIENQPNSTPTKDADSLFLSEASAQFRFFKNGWRVRVAHARATYNESQAKEAIDHVRSFFETLATRLKE